MFLFNARDQQMSRTCQHAVNGRKPDLDEKSSRFLTLKRFFVNSFVSMLTVNLLVVRSNKLNICVNNGAHDFELALGKKPNSDEDVGI